MTACLNFLELGKIPSFSLGPETWKNSELSSFIQALGLGKIPVSPPIIYYGFWDLEKIRAISCMDMNHVSIVGTWTGIFASFWLINHFMWLIFPTYFFIASKKKNIYFFIFPTLTFISSYYFIFLHIFLRSYFLIFFQCSFIIMEKISKSLSPRTYRKGESSEFFQVLESMQRVILVHNFYIYFLIFLCIFHIFISSCFFIFSTYFFLFPTYIPTCMRVDQFKIVMFHVFPLGYPLNPEFTTSPCQKDLTRQEFIIFRNGDAFTRSCHKEFVKIACHNEFVGIVEALHPKRNLYRKTTALSVITPIQLHW